MIMRIITTMTGLFRRLAYFSPRSPPRRQLVRPIRSGSRAMSAEAVTPCTSRTTRAGAEQTTTLAPTSATLNEYSATGSIVLARPRAGTDDEAPEEQTQAAQ